MKNLTFIILALFICFSINAFSVDGSTGAGRFNFQEKAKNKQSSRWTLEEWLAQKERNRMMDLWLAMYSPSPYEFYLGGNFQDLTSKYNNLEDTNRKQSARAELGAFATVIGLSGEYQNSSGEKISDMSGAINLRIAGNAVQGTHLILFYGNRNRNLERQGSSHFLRNQFYGGDINLYLNRHIGLQGKLVQYLAYQEESLGEVSGSLAEYGIFIDFGALRLSGIAFNEIQREVSVTASNKFERTGSMVGLKFFF